MVVQLFRLPIIITATYAAIPDPRAAWFNSGAGRRGEVDDVAAAVGASIR